MMGTKGIPEFNKLSLEFAYGADSPALLDGRIAAVQVCFAPFSILFIDYASIRNPHSNINTHIFLAHWPCEMF